MEHRTDSGADEPTRPIQRSANTESETDRSLLEAAKSGNRAALAQLYDHHAPYMLGLARLILQDRSNAEDLVHDVFIEAWRRADTYQPDRGSVRTWLLVRVRSRAIDRARMLATARKYAMVQSDTEEEVSSVGDDPSRIHDRFQVCRGLMSLSETQRIVVALGYFEGLTCKEIAERCDIPIGTVKSRLAAALAKLRENFSPVEGTE